MTHDATGDRHRQSSPFCGWVAQSGSSMRTGLRGPLPFRPVPVDTQMGTRPGWLLISIFMLKAPDECRCLKSSSCCAASSLRSKQSYRARHPFQGRLRVHQSCARGLAHKLVSALTSRLQGERQWRGGQLPRIAVYAAFRAPFGGWLRVQ